MQENENNLRKRGSSPSKGVNLAEGEKISVAFNAQMQPIGPNRAIFMSLVMEFSYHLLMNHGEIFQKTS